MDARAESNNEKHQKRSLTQKKTKWKNEDSILGTKLDPSSVGSTEENPLIIGTASQFQL